MQKGIRFSLRVYLALLGLACAVFMILITPHGAGVSPDSVAYIGGARNILLGNGFYLDGSPITHFPPLYSIVLAGAGVLDNNLVETARLLNAFLFGANAVLLALSVYLSAGRRLLTATCAALVFFSSASLIAVHAEAWSEPLFLSLTLLGILLLCQYIHEPRLPLLIGSSLSLGFAALTRYIGIAFLPGALVMVLVGTGDGRARKRLLSVLLWISLAIGPLALFAARNAILAGSATDRSLVVHPASALGYAANVIQDVFAFIAPISLAAGVRPLLFGLIGLFLVSQYFAIWRAHGGNLSWRSIDVVMSVSCAMFCICYLAGLFTSISYFDAGTPVDARLLSPVFVALIPGGFAAVWTVSATLKRRVVWWSFLWCIVLLLLMRVPGAARTAIDTWANGDGYTSREWRVSRTLAFVRSLPGGVKVYSNGRDVVSFWTDRQTDSVPARTSSSTRQENPDFDRQMGTMCSDVKHGRALLVYFNAITWRWYLPTEDEVESRCKLPVFERFVDGTVYGALGR